MSFKSSQVNCLLHQWHLESYLDCARTRPRTLLGALARSRTSRSPAPAPHILATTHGTWHTSGSEGRERSHANHMGESRGTSTNVHRPRVASRRPALPASLSVLRLRALLSIISLCNMFSPCTRRVAGRRASRPASPGSSALRRLLILEETEKLGVQSAAVNGCRLTIQNRPRRKRSTSIVHRRSREHPVTPVPDGQPDPMQHTFGSS